MSHRLSIVSSASNVDRRKLPPMRCIQPNTRRLRTWVCSTEDDSHSTNKLSRLIVRVRESVVIFPDDMRAVTRTDSSLPIMSYWYGKVSKIYLRPQRETHDVWLDIQWYYRHVDLEDLMVETHSKHHSVAVMNAIVCCTVPESPRDTAGNADNVPESKLPARYNGIQLEKDFISILTMPIRRGGPYGVVGNGWIYYHARSLLKEVVADGKLPDGWKASLTKKYYEVSDGSESVLRIIHGSLLSLPALEQTQCKHPHEIKLNDRRRGWGVFIEGLSDTQGSPDPLEASFRSAALNYYLWLDHKAGGFHEICRATLEKEHNVTFKSVENREGQDIISFLEWRTYHVANCHEYDICGAFQGCASEENLQSLLDAVDPQFLHMTFVDFTDTVDDQSTFPDITLLGSESKRSSGLDFSYALDTANQPISAINPMQQDYIQPLVESANTTMDVSFCPQETDSMIVVNSTNICNTVDDKFELSDFAGPCASTLAEMTSSSGLLLKPTISSFRRNSTGAIANELLGQWAFTEFSWTFHNDEDAPLDDAMERGLGFEVDDMEFYEIHGMFKLLRAAQGISEERKTIIDFFICAGQALHLSGTCIERGVQCDIESQLDPVDMGTDTAYATLPDCYLANDYQANVEGVVPSDDHNDFSADQSHISLKNTEPLFTMDSNTPSAEDWTLEAVSNDDCQSDPPTMHTTLKNHSDPPSDHNTAPRCRLRVRNVKKATCATVPTQKRHHENSVSQHDAVKDRAHTGRPVIFAGPLVQSKKKART
ncbi:hypothetical protein BDR07DRAFT_1386114 [Suillus spraguei]|nr:hypothetical protein BDR07DRAFT_1386114 [Suillus spraguei]